MGLMAFRPDDRLKAESAINHPWFKRAQKGELDQKELVEGLAALKSHHSGSRLKQAINNFFVHNLLSP